VWCPLQLHNYIAQNVLKKPVVIEEFGLTWFKKTPAQLRVLMKVRCQVGNKFCKSQTASNKEEFFDFQNDYSFQISKKIETVGNALVDQPAGWIYLDVCNPGVMSKPLPQRNALTHSSGV
jgi:hypothetical protein